MKKVNERKEQMPRMNKKSEVFTDSRTTSSPVRIEPLVTSSKPGNPHSSGTTVAEPAASKNKPVTLTHQQIEQRAKQLWRQKGCPSGQDVTIWCEAEKQLKHELGIK